MEGVSIVAMVYQYAVVFRSVHGETVMVHHFILGANVGNAIQIVPHWVRIVSKVAHLVGGDDPSIAMEQSTM